MILIDMIQTSVNYVESTAIYLIFSVETVSLNAVFMTTKYAAVLLSI